MGSVSQVLLRRVCVCVCAVADQLTSLSLTEIAGLVMPDESPLNLFRCYRMLSHDRLYFKQVLSKDPTVEPRYEPRSAEMVAAARALLAAEAEAREDEAAWSAAVRDALSKRRRSEQPSPEQWESGRHRRRIAALKVHTRTHAHTHTSQLVAPHPKTTCAQVDHVQPLVSKPNTAHVLSLHVCVCCCRP